MRLRVHICWQEQQTHLHTPTVSVKSVAEEQNIIV